MSDDRISVAAGLLPGDDLHHALLRSIVDVARAIFRAQAASVFLLDAETDELVFEAVSGEGEESLVGRRFPSSTGIAGWVLVTGQPLVLDDVTADPRFATQAAEATGYVPKGIMSVPLLVGERVHGDATYTSDCVEAFLCRYMQPVGLRGSFFREELAPAPPEFQRLDVPFDVRAGQFIVR